MAERAWAADPDAYWLSAVTRLLTVAGAVILLIVGTAALVPAQRALAQGIDVECLGSFSRAFDPGVTQTAHTTDVSGTYTYSTCATGPEGTGTDNDSVSLSCIPVTAAPAETETISWDDGASDASTIAWPAPTVVADTVVYDGTVTAGLYLGGTAVKVTEGVSYLGDVLGCELFGTPITSTTGVIASLLLENWSYTGTSAHFKGHADF